MQNVNWKRHGVKQHVSFNMQVGLHMKSTDFYRLQLSSQHFCNCKDSKRDNRQDLALINQAGGLYGRILTEVKILPYRPTYLG